MYMPRYIHINTYIMGAALLECNDNEMMGLPE